VTKEENKQKIYKKKNNKKLFHFL